MSNLTQEAVLAEQLIAGMKKHLANAGSLAFAGATYTPAQIEASLQTLADLRTAVDVAKAASKAQSASLRSRMAAFEAFVKVTYGNSPDVLADFGLKPRKAAAPLTVE